MVIIWERWVCFLLLWGKEQQYCINQDALALESCGIFESCSTPSAPWAVLFTSTVGNLKRLSDVCCRSSDVIHFSACTPFVHPPEEEVFTVGFYFKKSLQAAAERHLLLDLCCLLSENKTAHRSTLSSACWWGKNTLKTNDWSIELHFQ